MNYHYHIDSQPLKHVDLIKDLEVLFDTKLSFSSHVSNLCMRSISPEVRGNFHVTFESLNATLLPGTWTIQGSVIKNEHGNFILFCKSIYFQIS